MTLLIMDKLKEQKFVIKMKKLILILFLSISAINLSAQKKEAIDLRTEVAMNFEKLKNLKPTNPQEVVEDEITNKLLLNMKKDIIKDSIAMYAFAIKIKKNSRGYTIQEIKSNDTLCYKV